MASKFIRQFVTVAIACGLSAGVLAQQASQSSDTSQSQMRPGTAASTSMSPAATTDIARGTIIAPRDKISIRTQNFQQWSLDAIVDVDGTFDFGAIGRVKAAGL